MLYMDENVAEFNSLVNLVIVQTGQHAEDAEFT